MLYTNQKTKKRKLWKDGKLTVHNAGKKCRLYEAHPLPGTVGGGVIDELDLAGQQQCLGGGGCDELESEKYLIRIEGLWNDEMDGGNSSSTSGGRSALLRPNGGSRPGGGMLAMGSSTSSTTAIRSDGMKKLLSNKYRMPPKVMPLHPEDRRRRDYSFMAMAGGNERHPRKMPPLQPGELERRYFGDGGSGGGGNFGYDNGHDERNIGGRRDGSGYGNYERDIQRNRYEERTGCCNDGRMANYDEERRPIQSGDYDDHPGRIRGASSRNTNIGNDNMASRNPYRPSSNNDDSAGGIDQRGRSQLPLHDERGENDWQQQQQQDGRRQPSNPHPPPYPTSKRSSLNDAKVAVSSNFMAKENDNRQNAHQSFDGRGRGEFGSGHHSANVGSNAKGVTTTRFTTDGFDASGLYEEEESDNDINDDDADDNVDIGGHDNNGGRSASDSRQEEASSVIRRQTASFAATPVDDRHATDELLELLGVSTPDPAGVPGPPVDRRRKVLTETLHSQHSIYQTRPITSSCDGSNVDSTTSAGGVAHSDDNHDEDSSFLAGILQAEDRLQDRAIGGYKNHGLGSCSDNGLSSNGNGFGGWQNYHNDCDESFDGYNDELSNDENQVFAGGNSGDASKTNPIGLDLNNGSDMKDKGAENNFSGFTLPSADESSSSSSSSSEDEDDEE